MNKLMRNIYIKSFYELIRVIFLLFTNQSKKIIVFDLPSIGEIQFIKPVILEFLARNCTDMVWINHHGDTKKNFGSEFPKLKNRVHHVNNKIIRLFAFKKINLFITSEQYCLGLDGIYSISIFHGQPSKGLTFTPDVIHGFDAFFLYGPLHRQAFEEYIKSEVMERPKHLEIFDIGYPKSDYLLNKGYSPKQILKELSLDNSKKTIIYAPAFNEGASLREYGIDIIKLLASIKNYNIIVKLPIDCWEPTTNYYATGGVDWFKEIQKFEDSYDNLCFYKEFQIDPALSCSDVMVTCVSSVAFEFLALNGPVIYIDTPDFYTKYLKKQFPHEVASKWFNHSTVNAGKEFGLVVSDIHQLPKAIETVLSEPDKYPKQQKKLREYLLYNRGSGTKAAVDKIEDLLTKNVESKRPYKKTSISNIIFFYFLKLLLINIKGILNYFLKYFGYSLTRNGLGYIDATTTVRAAQNAGLSVCNYLESQERDKRKIGRRDRIIDIMRNRKLFNGIHTVVEIGTGTGMYLEKIIERYSPERYEIYETDRGWVKYLKNTFGKNRSFKLICQPADGKTLKFTKSTTCQLVHAHAVFVYIPFLKSFSYIREAARVLVPGGYLFFDCILDTSLNQADIDLWLEGPWHFPSIIPKSILIEFAQKYDLKMVDQYSELYGYGFVDYLLFQKKMNTR